MLIVVLIAAVCLYIVLYAFWVAAQSHLGTVTSVLNLVSELVLMPQHVVFLILRGLILVTLLYIISDLLLASTRRQTKRQPAKIKTPAIDRTRQYR